MKPVCWVIKCDRFGSILAEDGRFMNMTPVENIKYYKREGNATRKLLAMSPGFTAYALYDGDVIDCCGRITRNSGVSPHTATVCPSAF